MGNRSYKILLDGRWSLEDMMNFSRVYFQNYLFLYCLESHISNVSTEAVLKDCELRGGFSYVNIYSIFRSYIQKIQKQDIPQIQSIQYASPGWLELALNPDVADQFAKVLGIYLGAPVAATAIYNRLHKIFSDLKKRREEDKLASLKLCLEETKVAQKLCDELSKGLGFQSIESLNKYTKDVEESSKLMLAHYRRITKIAKFIQNGKASFPIKDEIDE
ncbi:hypothetical protein BSPLISOX_2512 [uncultured Gammaproteobacteria bacterium]|jgi:hypothetical protein|nr:hypothetical protein [uncultured Gammaproteobacteria bacterium]VVH65199.1 hypothetical protein BSPLISOX_2512 [uncultured Gammaproteobacteria bacterium]